MSHRSHPSPRFRLAAVSAIAATVAAVGLAGPAAAHASDTGKAVFVLQARPGDVAVVASAAQRGGGQLLRVLPALDTVIAKLPASAARQEARDPHVASVVPDSRLHLLSDTYSSAPYDPGQDVNSLYSIEQTVGSRSAWSKYTGAGVDVALIDSGISPVGALSAPGKILNGPDLSFDSQNPDVRYLDEYGHGTHLAGIIAGHDDGAVVSPETGPGPFLGIAPDARLVNVKVADAHGVCDVSQVIAAIDWVVQHAHDPGMNIRVLNLSFGTDSAQPYQTDPLAHAAEVAWRSGIVVVTSAGNSGKASGQLTDPAYDPYLIAVGADDSNGTKSTNDDIIPDFSSNGDGVRNPDLVAPGVHVQSLRDPGSYIDAQYASTGAINDQFFRGSGTSQAAAVVSGAAALLLQSHPSARPGQIKTLIDTNATALPAAQRQAQGNGLLNLRGIVGGQLPTTRQSWTRSTGGGSLDAARGSHEVTLSGVTLDGEQDIFGTPVDTTALAASEEALSSWTGGTWNGSSWAGSSWAGSSWAGVTWTGSSWAGSSWAGSSWADGTWTGSSWASGTWTGSSWAGSSWAGSSWAGSSWAGSSWATNDWS